MYNQSLQPSTSVVAIVEILRQKTGGGESFLLLCCFIGIPEVTLPEEDGGKGTKKR
jgi:hypothetical protein